ncbi:MAG: SCP2 sterol-binding domain-containing protein [Pseudoalteromonas sp.]|uniref:ubiquinone anaerobic biosynthesis accessory factor UbiT n=1 Tax=Pseudoalteromonas sp. TaxID=53249 RepID=UPI000C443736|nr:SCP2 sterol-binding domain-containing protein [Pseudoalteromonas sp.]MAB62053.1 hypothetical protein [Pseudoalteromonas sp.]NRA81058.1 SCP2 sterol-binding domain-containing protein [Pseudoalteromonas sp.]
MISLNEILKHKKPLFFTPKWLKIATHITPVQAINWLLETRLNDLYKQQIIAGELDFLAQKSVCIDVTNLPLSVFISLDKTQNRLNVIVIKPTVFSRNITRYDGRLSGCSDTFLTLMAGQSDPDTLFFSRKLSIFGDTELCLMVKNWLDTQDPEAALPNPLYHALQSYVQTLEN